MTLHVLGDRDVESARAAPRAGGCPQFTDADARPNVIGKFLFVGDEKFWVRGVTYGTFSPDEAGEVHVKSPSAREQRAMLAARSTLVARPKDIENSVRGLLRGFGLGLPRALRGRWEAGVLEAIEGHPTSVQIFEPLLMAREALREQLIILDKRVRDAARPDRVCRRLMSAPGVGAIVAMTFRAAVDQPDPFRSSKQVVACFGLTLRKSIWRARPQWLHQPRRRCIGTGCAIRGRACDHDAGCPFGLEKDARCRSGCSLILPAVAVNRRGSAW